MKLEHVVTMLPVQIDELDWNGYYQEKKNRGKKLMVSEMNQILSCVELWLIFFSENCKVQL